VTPAAGSAASGPGKGSGAVPPSGLDADSTKELDDGPARALVPEAAGGLVPPVQAETKNRCGTQAYRPAILAAVRREVWARDGGRCTWQGEDGRRCESRWQLELDHVVPVALGGPTTASNLRLTCRVHNGLSAERVFGPEYMARFRRGTPRHGEFTAASGGAR
jgi:hypothetical protein